MSGQNDVSITKLSDTFCKGEIRFPDGKVTQFNGDLKFKRDPKDAETQWRPGMKVSDDGSVYLDGELCGYVKILKSPPTSSIRDYSLDDIVIYVGQRYEHDLSDPEGCISLLKKYSK